MTEKIRKAVEDFKNENGNNIYSQKDLLMYIVKRIDNLPCNEHMRVIYKMEGDIKNIGIFMRTWKWIVSILITILISMIGLSYTI